MALQISINNNYGVPATYWHVGGIQQYFREGLADVTILGYADEAARRAQCQPLDRQTLRLTSSDDLSRPSVYALLKQSSQFEGAVDC